MLRIWMIPTVAGLAVGAHSAVVYDNLQNGLVVWNATDVTWFEAADLVELEGPERTLTGMTAWLWIDGWSQNSTVTYSVSFRIYDLDPVTGMPSGVLAETTLLNQQINWFLNQHVYVDMPSIQLDDEVMVGVRYFDVSTTGSAHRVGIPAAHPPVVGWSDPSYWFYNSHDSGWVLFGGQGGQGNDWGNLAFALHAVPEPATVSALAGLALLALRRRKR